MIALPLPYQEEFDDQWRAVEAACADAGLEGSEIDGVRAQAASVFPFSRFVTRNCLRHPAVLIDLFRSGDLHRSYGPGEMGRHVRQAVHDAGDDDMAVSLRRARRREMVRIAWRDLAGMADLPEVTADLTALAEAALDSVLQRLYRRQCADVGTPVGADGTPQPLVVIGMGKLGAGELNFSSDVDLVFAYPERGTVRDGADTMSTDEFFARLCRQLIKVIGESTAEGFVFRVDMRLRPDGENGPLVMSFDGMVDYYQVKGREWERYAWIKARPVAGDVAAGERLLERLNPFIYRRYLDYATFESLRHMKANIAREVRRKSLRDDIKTGPGGIREIEFFGQIFQLARGGLLPSLQERRIESILSILAAEGLVPSDVCRTLTSAYRFLRTVEHRLQEVDDQQTQRLPSDPEGRERLALSMGMRDWTELKTELDRHRTAVHGCFNDLLQEPDGAPVDDPIETGLSSVWQEAADPSDGNRMLASAGFEDPEEACRLLAHLRGHRYTRELTTEGRSRLDRLIPLLLKEVGGTANSGVVLNRVLEMVRAIERRTTYLALLLESPTARAHLVRLSAASPWIASFLAQYPALLDELLDARTLFAPPRRDALDAELQHRLGRLAEPDLEEQILELCLFKQVNVLRVASADITEVLPLMKVSDHLSDIAETVLNAVLQISWNYLVARHGRPVCRLGDISCDNGFVMIAYGKLGGLELGYRSDLDLVFLHAGTGGETVGGGSHALDPTTFFARLGQRMLHLLSTRTALGFLYETDMRLRPSGTSGLLVSHIDAFGDYQMDDAWTWEHQALLRARPIAGDSELANRFQRIRQRALSRRRDPEALRADVADMRQRLRRAHDRPDPGRFHIKQGRGGLIDIEFLVQYLILRHAPDHPGELLRWTDNVRQIRTLAACGVLDWETASFLRKAYLTFRSKIHRLNLQERPSEVADTDFTGLREGVAAIWNRYL